MNDLLTKSNLLVVACLWAALLAGCNDDPGEKDPIDAGMMGEDGGAADATSDDATNDAETSVDAEPDLPDPEFLADARLLSISVDDGVPQSILVTYDVINDGPDPLVMERCEWEVRVDGMVEGSGSFSFCDDCNPIEVDAAHIDADSLDGLGLSEDPGNVPAELTFTCLPDPNYEDPNLANNTMTESFNW